MSDYLTAPEAAAWIRLAPSTLAKLRCTGGGPRFHKLGRKIVYALAELKSWMIERECGSTSEVPPAAKKPRKAAPSRLARP